MLFTERWKKMEIARVGILLDDDAFAGALAAELTRQARDMRFRLLHTAEEGRDCHIVLFSGSYTGKGGVELIFDPGEEHLDGEPFRVYRYKSSPDMINDLLFIFFQMTGKTAGSRRGARCRLLLFTACGGGCGTTSAAISVCILLNRLYAARCLYLSLCPIDDSKKYLPDTEGNGMLKLLYYLETGREFPIGAFIAEGDELDYLRTGAVNPYADEIRPALFHRLLQLLEESGRYDFLVADMGNHLCRSNKSLLPQADLTFLFHSGQTLLPGKYRMEIAREIKKKTGNGKLIRVENFAADGWDETEERAELYISREGDLVTEDEQGHLQMNLCGNYGNELAAAVKKIMEECGDGEVVQEIHRAAGRNSKTADSVLFRRTGRYGSEGDH